MISAQNIVAWGNVAPSANQQQAEQELIIGRALVEIISNDLSRAAAQLCGGTVLSKLHFPTLMRYSQDFALVQMFGWYPGISGQATSRAQTRERMLAKPAKSCLLLHARPLLLHPAAQAEALTEQAISGSFRRVFINLIDWLPSEPWGRAQVMTDRFGTS